VEDKRFFFVAGPGRANEIGMERLFPAYWPLRLLPGVAAVLGLAGVILPGRPHLPVLAALLFGSALALEFGGWGRAMQTHGKTLGAAAVVGAGVGVVVLLALAPGLRGTFDPLIALR
jgi:hypothetical protein